MVNATNSTQGTNHDHTTATGREDAGQRETLASTQPEVLAVMRARLAAMARDRPDDSPSVAALRRMLRDETLMARAVAEVERWPPFTPEQLQTIAALMNPPGRQASRRQGSRRQQQGISR